jgi:6,7-dimethyl-8-ribityllumazine synthase
MATVNYSNIKLKDKKKALGLKIAIVTAAWNETITNNLESGAYTTLLEFGAKAKDIIKIKVPGSFELVYAAQLLTKTKKYDAVIILGTVIQGETRHFDFVCQGVTQGIALLNATQTTPVIFGLLTDNTLQQSIDRSGGILGNKGVECAATAIEMALMKKQFAPKVKATVLKK